MKQYTADQVRTMLWDTMKDTDAKPLSQKDLAKQIGVSLPFLNSTLNGAREPQGKVVEFLGLERVVIYRQAKRRERK